MSDTRKSPRHRKNRKINAAPDEFSTRRVEPNMAYAHEFEQFMETFIRTEVNCISSLTSIRARNFHDLRKLHDSLPDFSGLTEFACDECGNLLVRHVNLGELGYDFFGCSGCLDGCMALYDSQGGEPVRRG